MSLPAAYGVVLAAGLSSRFGSDKLLAKLRGKPVILHALGVVTQGLQSKTLAGGVVVIGPENEAMARHVAQAGLWAIVNDEPEAGLSHSLRLGLEALIADSDADAALVFAGDQPEVRSDVVAQLVRAWRGGAGPFVRPRYLASPTAPGHPVLIDREVWSLAGKLTGDAGFGPLLKQYPELVTVLDVPGTNPDIDTRDDLDRLWEPI